MKKHLVLIIGTMVLAVINAAHAQIETTSYLMNSLSQSVISNPAFVPKYKFSLTLPGTSLMAAYSNNGFSYNDLIRKEDGKVIADLSKWAGKLPGKTNITTAFQVDLLRLGIRINPKLYITLNSTAKAYNLTIIPKDVASLFVNGTTPYVGKSLSMSPELQLTSYLENALGFSYEVTKQLRIGARLKMLNGIVGINTKTSDLNVAIADNYSITASADAKVQTSGLHNIDQSGSFSDQISNYLQNKGWGIDLGGTYKLTDKLTLGASLIDIGQISWKNNTYEYSLDKATANYTFSGIDAKELFNGNSKPFKDQIDSIKNKFDWKEKQSGSFKSALPAKMYLSGSYEVTKGFTAGAIVFAEKFHGRFSPGLALAMNKNFGKVLSTSLSYTLSNRSFGNFGAGFSLNLAPVQIYLVGDNLLNMPVLLAAKGNMNSYINSTQVFTARAGINFVWGWIKNTDDQTKSDKSYNSKKKKNTKQGKPAAIQMRKKRR
jgi:hypothetical protein